MTTENWEEEFDNWYKSHKQFGGGLGGNIVRDYLKPHISSLLKAKEKETLEMVSKMVADEQDRNFPCEIVSDILDNINKRIKELDA